MPKFASPPMLISVGALLIAMVSLQTGASVAKGLFPLVGAQGATALRLGLAAVMTFALWRPWRTRVAPGSWRPIFAYGVSLGVMNLVFYMALRTIPLGLAVALEFTGPLTLAVIASRRPIDFLWVAFAVAGVLLLAPLGPASARLDPTGVLFALAAGVCWALYIVFGQKAGAGGRGHALAYGTIIAATVATPFGVLHAGARLWDITLLPSALTVALMTSVVPYALEMFAMTRLSTRTFGILMSAEPALGVLSGFLLLAERLSGRQMLAVATIIVASVGTVMTQKRPASAPAAN
jgi:inner membrane transporter RhtA